MVDQADPSAIMFLLGQERVILEMLHLVRMHMAQILKIEETEIKMRVTAEGGRLRPTFEVDQAVSGQWEVDYIQGVIRDVWEGWAREQLNERLRGLYEPRWGCGPTPQA